MQKLTLPITEFEISQTSINMLRQGKDSGFFEKKKFEYAFFSEYTRLVTIL